MDAAGHQRRVVVGVDGSPNSIAALHRAVAEAQRSPATLEAVLVLADESPHPSAYAAALEMLAEILIREYPDGIGVPVRRLVEHGDPAEVLVQLADGASLLVVGARDGSAAGNPLGGDVVPHCLTGGRCPLVICANHRARATV
jgi:nucleotide-binding universal stress UspA family protein